MSAAPSWRSFWAELDSRNVPFAQRLKAAREAAKRFGGAGVRVDALGFWTARRNRKPFRDLSVAGRLKQLEVAAGGAR